VCALTGDMTIVVHPLFNTDNPQTICMGQSYIFNSHSYSTAGTYTDTLSSIYGCDSVITTILTVNPLPVISFNPTDPYVCFGDSVFITASGASTYLWLPGYGLNTTSGSDVIAKPIVSTTYTVTGVDNNSCTGTSQITVNIVPIPRVKIVSDTSVICPGTFYNLRATSGFSSYLWSNGMTDPVVNVDHGGLFFVQAWDVYNCTNTDTIFINEDCISTLYIPNAFTPNGDGKNDFFDIVGENILSLKLWIYNRWGELVFYSNDINYSWDGKLNGKPVEIGVYSWYMEYESYYEKTEYFVRNKAGIVSVIK